MRPGLPVRRVVLVLGSNIEPERNVPRALELLRSRLDVRGVSAWYRSPAVGGEDRYPPFVNVGVQVATSLPPRALREVGRLIEERCGRQRVADRFAPRTMDVDVVLVDGYVGRLGSWALPDPELHVRAHLLVPAAEAWPEGVHPVEGRPLAELAGALPDGERARLERVRSRGARGGAA